MVDKLGPQKVSLIERTMLKVSLYRSEWPPPDYVADAENALPGSGRQIIDAVASKIEVQNRLSEMKATGAVRRMNRGQIIGLATIVMGLACATYIATLAPSYVTMTIAVVAIIATVGGPNVARVIADSIYLQRTKPPQPPAEQPSREKTPRRRRGS